MPCDGGGRFFPLPLPLASVDDLQRAAINAVVAFVLVVAVYVGVFGDPVETSLVFGAVAGLAFGVAMYFFGDHL